MRIDEVLTKFALRTFIKAASALDVKSAQGMFCVVCYRRAARLVSVYQPYGDVLPLCQAHFDEVEAVVSAEGENDETQDEDYSQAQAHV